MTRLNIISVVNADKIKIGKENIYCNIINKAIVYVARVAESSKDVKIVLDEYSIIKKNVGFDIVLNSDAIDAVVFNKKTNTVKNKNSIECFIMTRKFDGECNNNLKERLSSTYVAFANAVEQSDCVVLYVDDVVDNFVRRYVSIMMPSLCDKAPVILDRIPSKLVNYLDKLDVVESVVDSTSAANVAYQLECNKFDVNLSNGKLPVKTLQKLTKANLDTERIARVESYVASGKGTVEDVERFFTWCTAVKKLYEKSTGYSANTNTAFHVIDLLEYGFTLTDIMTKISVTLMNDGLITELTGNRLAEYLAKIMEYRKLNNINDFTMPENIITEYTRMEKLYDISQMRMNERFSIAAKAFNKKYANAVDGIMFACPTNLMDFDRFGRVNKLSKTNLDLFLENKIMIFALLSDGGFFTGPIFAFDEFGNVKMIHGVLNEQQMNAVKTLWNKIERNENNV